MNEENPPPINLLKINKKDSITEDNLEKPEKVLEKIECDKTIESSPTDLSPTPSPQSNALLGPVSHTKEH